METIFSSYTGPNRQEQVGVSQEWYAGDTPWEGIHVGEELIERPRFIGMLYGVDLGGLGVPARSIDTYDNQSFLYEGVIITHRERKTLTGRLAGTTLTVPPITVILTANTQSQMEAVAKKLKLPLEELVEQSQTVSKE